MRVTHKLQIEGKKFELGTEFIFFILHCSYNVGQYEYKNTLMLAFYLPYLKGCFFAPSRNRHGTYLLKYFETNNTEQCPRRNEKHISYIHLAINFCIPAKFLFSHNFHNLVLAQI